ncbi:2-C-methyl-D-erythritol 4-phosphate cytidylyltransferase [Thalassotalea euphylliae]|uniref:2-C-methyl-D-erythritol 4-phosphate cytidylyltransferase n=1 Tax=Thalassotalea euphylliae TaxID=1655234 RepID=UPI003634F59C
MNQNDISPSVTAVVPAAGAGKRMQSQCPKQYLMLGERTILEHTVDKLLASKYVNQVIVAISEQDEYFADTSLFNHPNINTVIGGKERVDSVLAGLKSVNSDWVMVHDAARPCVKVSDIDTLVEACIARDQGGILAARAKDTIKRSATTTIELTVDRSLLWHAYTPQMYKTGALCSAIENGLAAGITITDESSAIEAAGLPSHLIEASSDNIKVTQPEDLALAAFILSNQQEK